VLVPLLTWQQVDFVSWLLCLSGVDISDYGGVCALGEGSRLFECLYVKNS
jgi:hypothetical protein